MALGNASILGAGGRSKPCRLEWSIKCTDDWAYSDSTLAPTATDRLAADTSDPARWRQPHINERQDFLL